MPLFPVPVNISVKLTGRTTLKENDSLFLNCSASGFPRPTGFTWTKRDNNAFNATNSWLNFTGITPEEAGGYICHANNTCGEGNSSVISINVQCKHSSFRFFSGLLPWKNERPKLIPSPACRPLF